MEMVRYCAVCDDEFRPEITICSDCGGALVLQQEGLGAMGLAALGVEAPVPEGAWRTALDALPASTLVPVRTFDSLADLEPAVAAFADQKLPSRVLVQNGRYILLIRREDLDQAHAALHEALVDAEDSPDPSFDARAGRYASCPACETRLPERFDGACPECGLELAAPPGNTVVPEGE